MKLQTCLIVIVILFCCSPLYSQSSAGVKYAKPEGPLYSLPYPPGEEFRVGQGYLEFPTHEKDYAVDWGMPEGTPILAAREGVVTEVVDRYRKGGVAEEYRGKDNHVFLQHDDGTYTMYVHLGYQAIKVKVGQRVKEGEEIALSGNTGYSATPHLHFMAYKFVGGTRVSFPVRYKSGTETPYEIFPQAKYLAPGGTPLPEEGPLKDIKGTGELTSIRPKLIELIKGESDNEQAAFKLKDHLMKNRKAYHDLYKKMFARSQSGDKSAMKELQEFMNQMDLQAAPEIAKLKTDPASAGTTDEAMLIWWDLYALP
jgi:hypothetical protein